MKIFLKMFGALFFLISNCASANDSVARVGAGGLELLKTDNIQMVSEELEISVSKIRVKYHFLNTSDKDIKTTVAFPMPAFEGERRVIGGEENQRPLESFQIRVNGNPVSVRKNRVFLIKNVDVTDKLRKAGLTDEQIFDPLSNCLGRYQIPSNDLTCNITDKNLSVIKSLPKDGPWQIQETAIWEQRFPAGKEIEVTHEYQPFVSSGANIYGSGEWELKRLKERGTQACLDEQTLKALLRKRAIKVPLYSQEVEYILGTGRNWSGPIKQFKLIIRKAAPDEIVSLCFPGNATKTSPTTLEFTQTDYVPQDRLVVFFYH